MEKMKMERAYAATLTLDIVSTMKGVKLEKSIQERIGMLRVFFLVTIESSQ